LWPAFDAASIGIDANPILDAKTEDVSQNYPTIGDLINSGFAQENVWYWVNIKNVNRDIDAYSPAHPLLEGKNAIVIPPREYFSNYRIVSDGCQAYSLKKIITQDGGKFVLAMKITILHWGKKIILNNSVIDEMQVNELEVNEFKEGVYYFDIIGRSAKKLSPEDIAFLKNYYRIYIKKYNNANQKVTCEKIRPLIVAYRIYEYYQSGYMKRRIIINESGLLRPPRNSEDKVPDRYADDRDKYIEYTIRDRAFNDKGMQQTSPEDEKITTLYDRTSPYWLQNMLHD
jgi:hypothetical protein